MLHAGGGLVVAEAFGNRILLAEVRGVLTLNGLELRGVIWAVLTEHRHGGSASLARLVGWCWSGRACPTAAVEDLKRHDLKTYGCLRCKQESAPHIVRDGALCFGRSLDFGSASDGPHRAADLFAIVARLDALLHDSVLMALACHGTVAAGVGTGGMGVFRHRAAACHQSGRQSAECLTVHGRLVSLGVMFGVRSALLDFAEAVAARLVADLATFIQDLDMPVVLMPFIATGSGTA
jgi:hypothetical protein